MKKIAYSKQLLPSKIQVKTNRNILILAITFSAVLNSPLLKAQGFGSWTTGGSYENLVLAGEVLIAVPKNNGDGESSPMPPLPFVITGGNHASEGLGYNFPWVFKENGNWYGTGFNDMILWIDGETYGFGEGFIKPRTAPVLSARSQSGLGDTPAKILRPIYDNQGFLTHLLMNKAIGKNLETGKQWSLSFAIAISSGNNDIFKREGMFRFPLPFKNHLLGLKLRETPINLNPIEPSWILLVETNPEKPTHEPEKKFFRLKSAQGGFERSDLTVLASPPPGLDFHIGYDYLGVYPMHVSSSAQCFDDRFVGYISSILNAEDGPQHRFMDGFAHRYGSSAFWFNGEGTEIPINNFHRYPDLKTIEAIESLSELDATVITTSPILQHDLGIGSFDRRVIILEKSNGCRYGGLWELQNLY